MLCDCIRRGQYAWEIPLPNSMIVFFSSLHLKPEPKTTRLVVINNNLNKSWIIRRFYCKGNYMKSDRWNHNISILYKYINCVWSLTCGIFQNMSPRSDRAEIKNIMKRKCWRRELNSSTLDRVFMGEILPKLKKPVSTSCELYIHIN